MSFDIQGFAEGFLGSGLKRMEKREDEASAYKDQQLELAERNKGTVTKRNAIVSQVVGLTNMLRSNGASERVIQAAVSAGPQEITALANKVEQARKVSGRSLGESDIEALINVPEGFSVIDMGTEDFIKKTYGLGYEDTGVSTKEMPRRSLGQRWRGEGLKERARAKLDSAVIQDGLTAYDINQIAAQQDYESLVPGTFVTFNDFKVFNPATDMQDFTRTMSNLRKDVEDSSAFGSITDQIKENRTISDLTDEERATRNKDLVAQRDQLYLDVVAPTIEAMVSDYGADFMDATEGYLRNFLSRDYVDSLMLPDVGSDNESGTDNLDLEAATSTGVTIPEVTVTELPPASEAVSPQSRPVIEEEEPKEEPEEEEDGAFVKFLDNATTLGSSKETASTNIDNKNTMRESMAAVTREEWNDMSRKERREAGLPVRKLDIAYAGKDAFKQEEVERVKTVKERAAERFGGIDPAVFDEAIDSGRLTELDLAIFADSGDEIVDFIKDNLYGTSSENVLEGLTDWAKENNKILPTDKSFLIKTFQSALEG
jgi:hypothetical protein